MKRLRELLGIFAGKLAAMPEDPIVLPEKSSVQDPPEGYHSTSSYQNNDVFIVGYPKSGNTWVQNLVAGAVYGLDIEFAPDRLVQDVVPDVHMTPFYRRYRPTTFFKTHHLPMPDVMVSYLHFLNALNGQALDFLKIVETGEQLFPCKWHEHVEQWLVNPYAAEMITVRYEDLKKDALQELGRICDFAGEKR